MARCSEYFMRLSSGYLFPEVARRIRRWQERNPGADVMRLSIGNTTEPITPHIAEAMKKRICMLSDTVLELVRIIHTKGKIITTEPRIRKKYVRKVDVRLDCPRDVAFIWRPP